MRKNNVKDGITAIKNTVYESQDGRNKVLLFQIGCPFYVKKRKSIGRMSGYEVRFYL